MLIEIGNPGGLQNVTAGGITLSQRQPWSAAIHHGV